jgi:hypothetical protein
LCEYTYLWQCVQNAEFVTGSPTLNCLYVVCLQWLDRICGLGVSVEDYKHRGHGFDSRAPLRIFLRELGLERGLLSLVIG